MLPRVPHSYDRLAISPDHVTWARQIIDAHGGKNSKSIEAALRTIGSYDSSLPRQVVEILKWHLAIAYTREAKARNLTWRPKCDEQAQSDMRRPLGKRESYHIFKLGKAKPDGPT